MKTLRRVHLYAGLFLLPWVLLYGVTAMLFNHPSVLGPARTTHPIHQGALDQTPLAHFPTAPEVAASVVTALNAQAGAQETSYALEDGGGASYVGDLFISAEDDENTYSLRYDVDTRGAAVRTTKKSKRGAPALAFDAPQRLTNPIGLAIDDERALRETADALLSNARSPEVARKPSVEFTLRRGDEAHRVRYSLSTGAVTPIDEGAPLSPRRFLTRLHTSHTYPASLGPRWVWAVFVDAMFVLMVYWGLSGVLMWWQMKPTRRSGAIVLALSLVVAAFLAVGMHGAMTS